MTDLEWENPVVLEGQIEVEAAPVDDLVDFSGGLVVAKVDVEGSEMAVLAGMVRTIANNRCLFQIESFESKFSELRGWLSERGFEYVEKCGFDHFFIKTVLRAPPERHF